jgi:hypothetical protein
VLLVHQRSQVLLHPGLKGRFIFQLLVPFNHRLYKLSFKIELHFDFLPKACNFLLQLIFYQNLACEGLLGVEMEVLSYPLSFFQSSQREEKVKTSLKPENLVRAFIFYPPPLKTNSCPRALLPACFFSI